MATFLIKRQMTGTGVVDYKTYTYASWSALFSFLDNQDTFLALEIGNSNSFVDLDSNGSLFGVISIDPSDSSIVTKLIRGTNLSSVNNYVSNLGLTVTSISKFK